MTSNNPEYTALTGGPESHRVQQSLHQQQPEYFTDDDDDYDTLIESRNIHEQANVHWWQSKSPQLTSGYLTLIPLSDSRLKPRNTRMIVGAAIFLCIASVCIVFFTVARGVTVGSIEVVNSTINFNTSAGTYSIMLRCQLPIYNPNYAAVLLTGRIKVSFYDQNAGYADLNPVLIHARAQPQIITVDVNSSNVPQKYLFTIYTQCFTFPEKLIFFLDAQLKTQYLGSTSMLPKIDNYAILECGSGESGG
ncbi:hypothetical protein CEUSTIGMA_g2532.t1 [Chlamydomonas eustigma]|uniref:Uncharacterized protein n=1 Tax=Chlamydomonas eustigma TaxID=1157962 RepID=A0A250WW76_9CHLO|nr:hypothetical protein CEUSTIGMA_g2532.t1 [Chlamydomonas eustigma]|eukprot:GAX75088.1 hypothetical protein CEUSTIGMA_g2532.t1 [Chlamydomonas eustigma]